MAKKRYIDTKFRSDGYISELSNIEKLVFIYFLSNQYTNLSWIYEITLKQISLDTGIDNKEELLNIIDKFSKWWKIYYIDWWVCIKNFQKHQNLDNVKIKWWIKNEIQLIPINVLEKIWAIDKSLISHIWDITFNLIKSNIDVDIDWKKQWDKISDAQRRSVVNTKWKFLLKIWNEITGRNDLMENDTFRWFEKFIMDTSVEDFQKRVELYKNCTRLTDMYKLSKFFDTFWQNQIQWFSITDFIKKINLFWGSKEDVFKKIVNKEYITKVLRMINPEIKALQDWVQKAYNSKIHIPTKEEIDEKRKAVDEFRKKFWK